MFFIVISILLVSQGIQAQDDKIFFPDDETETKRTFVHFGARNNEPETTSQSTPFPKPVPCPNEQEFCGGDVKLYPLEDVSELVRKTLSLGHSKATRDQFFMSSEEERQTFSTRGGNFAEQQSLTQPPTACPSVTETIPVLARAMNREGKWKYLVQMSGDQIQHHQIVKCSEPGQLCVNDKDSPTPRSTICRQVFKTARMLAFDEEGEIEVDSFNLPSACVCHFIREEFRVLLRGSFQKQQEGELCKASVQKLDKPEVKFLENLQHRKPQQDSRPRIGLRNGRQFDDDSRGLTVATDSSFVEACPDGEAICQTGDDFYPEEKIKPAIKDDTVLNSSGFFANVFGAACVPRNDTTLRNAFDRAEQALCDSIKSYIFPKRAQNIHGVWRYIVNSEEYQQGVTISKCEGRIKGRSCRYAGQRGQFPDATECRQLYTRHNMLAVSEDGDVFVDSFRVPSTCICSIVEPDYFDDDGF